MPISPKILKAISNLMAAGTVPNGYACVPIEPSQPMYAAARTSASGSSAEKSRMKHYWKKMLAARPTLAIAMPVGLAEYVLVPLEPTDMMYETGATQGGTDTERLLMCSYWKNMVKTALS